MRMSKITMIVAVTVSMMLSLLGEHVWAQSKVIGVIVYENQTSSNRRAGEAFVANATKLGWKTIVVDGGTKFDKIRAAFDDFIAQKVDGIANALVDPQMIQDSLEKAKAAGIPVVNIDAGYDPNVITNLTTNNYMAGGRYASYLLDTMRQHGKTQLLATVFAYHYATRIRYEILKAALLDYPEISLIEEHPAVAPGTEEDSAAWLSAYLNAHPEFEGGVWNAWDGPAEGVVSAIEQLGRKNIDVVGIDGSEWALDQLRKTQPENPFIGTEVQNFELMGAIAVQIMQEIFDGAKKPSDFPSVIYIPSLLLTQKNVPDQGYPWTSSGEYKPGYEQLAPWPQY